jgi:acetyl-CoA acyltransferase 1
MLPARTAGLVKVLTENSPSIPEKLAPQHTYKDDDIVIVSGLRSPITKAKRGGLKNLKADNLLAVVLAELMKRTPKLKMDRVGDIIVGNCLQPGGGQAMARIAMFEAGFPYSVPVASINRQCSSGLQSVASVAAHITNGDYSLAIAGGVESMSSCSFEGAAPVLDLKAAKTNKHAADCMVPMGITSENVAAAYGITRREQDRYVFYSMSLPSFLPCLWCLCLFSIYFCLPACLPACLL